MYHPTAPSKLIIHIWTVDDFKKIFTRTKVMTHIKEVDIGMQKGLRVVSWEADW